MKYNDLDLGRIEAIVNKLGGMEGVSLFLSGKTSVQPISNVIDCSQMPKIPKNAWGISKNVKGVPFEWNPEKIELYQSPRFENDEVAPTYEELLEELNGRVILGGMVLDFLLEHQHLIPEEWANLRTYIFFPGTEYYDYSTGRDEKILRAMYKSGGGEWLWSYKQFDKHNCDDNSVYAVLKQQR